MSDARMAPLAVARRPQGRQARNVRRPARVGAIPLRSATVADAASIHALIAGHLEEGHLLPRTLDEIVVRADRFLVALHRRRIVACAELAPLSRAVAEIRSLVVSREARHLGLGRRIVAELIRRATLDGFTRLCAFTHAPSYFVHMGFSIVPHVWLPEKIVTDCHCCPHFRQCGQYAVMHDLARHQGSCVPLAQLHG